MAIKHHPDDATLMSYAAGSIPEALGAVVATHLSLCQHCRNEVRAMERLGATLMDGLRPVSVTHPAPKGVGDTTGVPANIAVRTAACPPGAGELPAPLSKFVGPNARNIAWKRLGFGVWHYLLPLSKDAKGDLRLLKVGPGQAMPVHGHGGSELTLILEGCYRDEIGEYFPGDVSDLDDEVVHRPMADRELGCICLIASDEKAKFKGLLARMIQPLVGL